MDIAAPPKTGAKATVAWLWIWLACQAAVAAYAVFALNSVAAFGGTPSPTVLPKRHRSARRSAASRSWSISSRS